MNLFKKHILPTLVIIVLIGAAFYVGGMSKELEMLKGGVLPAAQVNNERPTPKAGEVAPVSEDDHILGNKDANIALIEYSDYECPYCQRFHETAKQIISDFGDEVMWVYRHFPLESIHADARPAAIAAECVASLGGNDAFWTFTDNIFKGGNLSEAALVAAATDLDINITTCLQDEAMSALVDEDLSSGKKAGVTGTPGNIILNIETGETILLPGALPYAQVKQAIESLQ